MSKKFIIILISSVLGLLLLSLIGYYFIIQGNDPATGGKVSVFKNFFPFGGNETPVEPTPNPEETPAPQPEPSPQSDFTQKLRQLSIEPIAGAGTIDNKVGTVVRYIEKATGHIYEVELFSPKHDRISNTTIPVVYDALWGNKNASLITRYLRNDDTTVDTYSLTVKNVATTTTNTISGIMFPAGVSDVSINGSSVFYLQQGTNTSSGFVSNFDGSKKKLIWNSDIKELLSQYVNTSTVALTTKPYSGVPGFMYFVNTGTGSVKSILSNISGLSTLTSPDGAQVLYLSQGNTLKMSVLDLKTKVLTNITPATFPEKCVWSTKDSNIVYCAVPREQIDGNSLTSWYLGYFSFADDIWKYDIKNNVANIVGNLTEYSKESLDVIKPMLSQNEHYLIFVNKVDNTLWSLDLIK